MTNNVYWMLELSLNDGAVEEWRSLMEEMVAATKANEPETIAYEWWLSEDESTCHLYERYQNTQAAKVHLQNFGKNFAKRFMGLSKTTRFVVYGDYDEGIVKALSPMNAEFMSPLGGFAR